jgi:hypothetical protein
MSAMPFAPDGIARTIQIALAPSFLLTAIGAILALLTSRLGRVVDRSRWIEANYAPKGDPRHDYQLAQLRWIDLRMKYANRALVLCTLSAMLICIVIAGLFTSALFNFALGQAMAMAFIVAMLLLIIGMVYFLYEVRTAIHATRIQDELLERDG